MVERRQSQQHPWVWFKDKILAPLFVTLTVSFCMAAAALYQGVQALTSQVTVHAKEIENMKAEMKTMATKSEMLEVMKRVELQLELMMAQAKLAEREKRVRLEK